MFENNLNNNSKICKIFLLEKNEIERLKWIESEKAGKDIGYYRASWLWSTLYRKKWLENIKKN